MKKTVLFATALLVLGLMASAVYSAYHHEGERDTMKFLTVYPDKAGTKLDHCALCHTGGSYFNGKKWVSLGSCQWCHYKYGYDGLGASITDTLNPYGMAYRSGGSWTGAISAIENEDSDGDGFTNIEEIQKIRFPGDPNDDPTKKPAPFRIYSRAELEAMPAHTQFLLMNTARSGDFYAEYTGVPMSDLLDLSGILGSASGVNAYAPDGFAQYHPLQEVLSQDPNKTLFYHVYGSYEDAVFHYDPLAEAWCDYNAPSCIGRNNGDVIYVENGLKMILAYRREAANMDAGILNEDNKLDGEGPFRVVPPQIYPSQPDQSESTSNPSLIWPYDRTWDHNAGASIRSVTMIRVEPLPAGTTDINVLEAGWSYVDQEKIVVYGALYCNADMDQDGDLDGVDLAMMSTKPWNENLNLDLMAGDFGRPSCP